MANSATVAELTVTPAKPAVDPDEVSIAAAGEWVSGWQSVAITRSLDQCPNSFQLGYTERDGVGATTAVKPGDAAVIRIGSDVVITGYADQVRASFEARAHSLSLAGRGKCQDLVDCTAEWPTATIANADVLEVAKKLSAPYGITVSLGPNTTLAAPLPAFNITLTETPFALIEEMARHYQVLAYEDPDGNLLLSAVGKTAHASGFKEGVNVQAATAQGAMDQRFSEYYGYGSSTQIYSDLGDGYNLLATATDPGVKRHRRRAVVVDAPMVAQDLGKRRMEWERTRRAGRALQVNITVDSWRDSAGKLWTPNQLAPVSLPSLHVDQVNWVIAEVTFLRDAAEGTRALVTLMAAEAFSPEPVLLQPLFADITPAGPAQ